MSGHFDHEIDGVMAGLHAQTPSAPPPAPVAAEPAPASAPPKLIQIGPTDV